MSPNSREKRTQEVTQQNSLHCRITSLTANLPGKSKVVGKEWPNETCNAGCKFFDFV